jgi:hypothetical protein
MKYIGLPRPSYPLAEMLKSHMSKVSKRLFFFSVLLIIGQICVMGSDNLAKSKILSVDYSKIAVLPNDTSDFWIFPTGSPLILTKDDFQDIEQLLDSTIDSYNTKQQINYLKMIAKYPNLNVDRDQFVIKLPNYKRQYIAIINRNGEKEVCLNFFCKSFQDDKWKTQWIEVMDGGNCFFHLKINLTRRFIYNFSVNGVA